MSKHAKIVLWLGLFMIVAGVIKNWSDISSLLFSHGIPGSHPGQIGPAPQNLPPKGGKCPPGYFRQPAPSGGFICTRGGKILPL